MPENFLDSLDYYALFQVPRTARSDEIRAAFHRFAAKYHPDRFLGAGESEHKVERASEIYRRGAEAYRVLMDGARRTQYDLGLAQGHLRYESGATDPTAGATSGTFPIQVKNPLARPFALKAEQNYKAGDFGSAKVNLKMALQKDGGNANLEWFLKDVEARLAAGVRD